MIIFNNIKIKKSKPKNRFFLWFTKAYAFLYPMAKRWKHHFHGGVFPDYQKTLSARHPLTEQFLPKTLILPLQQHVGLETLPLVKKGDRVLKNQCIADTEKGLSAPIHAPTSGVITAIKLHETAHPSGLPQMCIFLEPDGTDQALENSLNTSKTPPETPEELKTLIHKAGIVGMGGAGFPTFAKLPKQKGQIKTLLINGAECEPFITCDDLYMQLRPKEVIQGAILVANALGASEIICGIEENKPNAIQAMKLAAQNTSVTIKTVPTVYPMGGQKQLTKELTGIETPAKAHAIDIGLLMMNIQTFGAIYQAIEYGNPLIQRFVSVTGNNLKEPQNVNALMGTPFEELIQLAQLKTDYVPPVIMGGPMMGVQVKDIQVPVIKTTNCILVNIEEDPLDVLPCIRCGECMDACPISLLPQQLYWHSRSEEYDKVEAHHIFDCIECGCCSFVCPSNIPLVQYYRHSKAAIKQIKQDKEAANLAKQRHEFKLARIEREKAEKEARMKAKKAAVKKQASEKPKPAAAAAAARAAAARASANKAKSTSEAPKLSARDRAIAAAKKRTQAAKQTAARQNNEESNPS